MSSQAKIDCHHHIFAPQRFPYAANTYYRPSGQEVGDYAAFAAVMASYEIGHSLIVQPNSGYGVDNRCLLDALARSQGRSKGIAVVAPDCSLQQLAELQQHGVIGVAFNGLFEAVAEFPAWQPLLERLAQLDMFLQLQFRNHDLFALLPVIEACPVKLLIDHCGHPDVAMGTTAPAFAALLALGRSGRASIKLSGCHRFSRLPWPHRDTWPFMHALAAAFTLERCMWGSDWPFLRATRRVDYGPLLTLMQQAFPDAGQQRQLFHDTPQRLFGFSATPDCVASSAAHGAT